MIKICGIYKIISPIKKIYIGQSIDIIKRWKKYERLHCDHQSILFNSIKKYGFNNHKFEILHQCEREKLNELEKYYVDLFQSFNSKFGMNLKDGGGAKAKTSDETRMKLKLNGSKYWLGKKLSPESIKKGSLARTGQKLSNQAKINISKGHIGLNTWSKGCTHTEQAKLKISNSGRGRKQSKETKDKIGIKNSGKKQSTETLEKLSKIRKKKILQFDINMNFIEEFDSIKGAQEDLSLHNISSCLTGKLKTCGGFIWKYKIQSYANIL